MITFLFSVLVCVFLASFWYFIIEYCIAIKAGQDMLGKEEFKRQSDPVKSAYINFLENFNPALRNVEEKENVFVGTFVILSFITPLFMLGSLICMIFQI